MLGYVRRSVRVYGTKFGVLKRREASSEGVGVRGDGGEGKGGRGEGEEMSTDKVDYLAVECGLDHARFA